MEVHHNAHHHEGKTWKQYFWEFFMLFLAVFCGSVAELQMEHYIEHQREKKLMQSYHNDLITDISNLKKAINFRKFRQPIIDSAMEIIHNGPEKNSNYLYYATAWIVRAGPATFTPAEATIQQLKNAGNLRLIGSQTLIDSIQSYDAGIRSAASVTQVETESMIESFRQTVQDIFDGYFLNKMITGNNVITMPAGPLPVRKDEAAIHRYKYWLHVIRVNNHAILRLYSRLLQRAETLEQMITASYEIKNESEGH